jgi:hypothetical protein
MKAPKNPALAERFENIRRGIIGAFATFHSTRIKAPRPANPIISGARTLAECHGSDVPPVVSPNKSRVVAATKTKMPV